MDVWISEVLTVVAPLATQFAPPAAVPVTSADKPVMLKVPELSPKPVSLNVDWPAVGANSTVSSPDCSRLMPL